MDNEDQISVKRQIATLLKTNNLVKIGEIILVFLLGIAFIQLMSPLAGENPVKRQAIVWTANILMLFLVWAGMRLRGEKWRDFGLTFRPVTWREGLKTLGLILVVFLLAIAGFALGSVIMVNITGIPEGADMSSYQYLKDHIGMLLLTLAGVYIVSSFGEEVIYRAFLINRISQLKPGSRNVQKIAILLSAIIFGLIHYDWGPMGMVQTGLMGLALGICYIWLNKRLWILIFAHAIMDTILMVQQYLAL